MSINIDTNSAKIISEQLPDLAQRISFARERILSVTSLINPEVLDRANLRARLRVTQGDIESLGNDLLLLHRNIMQNIINYEEIERQISAKVQNITTI